MPWWGWLLVAVVVLGLAVDVLVIVWFREQLALAKQRLERYEARKRTHVDVQRRATERLREAERARSMEEDTRVLPTTAAEVTSTSELERAHNVDPTPEEPTPFAAQAWAAVQARRGDTQDAPPAEADERKWVEQAVAATLGSEAPQRPDPARERARLVAPTEDAEPEPDDGDQDDDDRPGGGPPPPPSPDEPVVMAAWAPYQWPSNLEPWPPWRFVLPHGALAEGRRMVRIFTAPVLRVWRRSPSTVPTAGLDVPGDGQGRLRRWWAGRRTASVGEHSTRRLGTRPWSERADEQCARWQQDRERLTAQVRWLVGEATGATAASILPDLRAALRPPRRTFPPAMPSTGCLP